MKMSKMVLLGLLSLSLAASVQARSFGEIYTQCGLGGALASSVPAVAAITNITWDLGTTAITSNISSEGTCAGKSEKVVAFISDSYENLEKDLAQGEGKYLDTLISMTKPTNTTKEAFVASIRSEFAPVVASNATNLVKSEALYNIVM